MRTEQGPGVGPATFQDFEAPQFILAASGIGLNAILTVFESTRLLVTFLNTAVLDVVLTELLALGCKDAPSIFFSELSHILLPFFEGPEC